MKTLFVERAPQEKFLSFNEINFFNGNIEPKYVDVTNK